MALYAFDGTGNDDREGEDQDSNVLDFFRGYDDPLKNDDPQRETRQPLHERHRHAGQGIRRQSTVAEAFGIGGHAASARRSIGCENNIEAGDSDIHIVGFSRGAALALSFANEIASKMNDGAASRLPRRLGRRRRVRVTRRARQRRAQPEAFRRTSSTAITRWRSTRARAPLSADATDGTGQRSKRTAAAKCGSAACTRTSAAATATAA